MHFWNTIWMYFIQYEWCTCTLWDHITRKLSVSLIMFVNFSLNAITRHHFNRFKLMRFALKMFRNFFHWNICVWFSNCFKMCVLKWNRKSLILKENVCRECLCKHFVHIVSFYISFFFVQISNEMSTHPETLPFTVMKT